MGCGCRQSLKPKYGVLIRGEKPFTKDQVPHCLGIAKTEQGLVYGFAEKSEATQFVRFLEATGRSGQPVKLG
jgi:hypothetical protein